MKPTLDVSYQTTTDEDPYAFYRQLLQKREVHWDPQLNAWLVASYEGCKHVMRNDDISLEVPKKEDETRAALFGGPRALPLLKGNEHEKLHRWWVGMFSPRRMEEWRVRVIRPIAEMAVDRFIERGTAELCEELSEVIPIRVISRLMGLPWEDDSFIENYRRLNHPLVAMLSRRDLAASEGSNEDDRIKAEGLAAARSIEEMMMPYITERRSGTGDDLISAMWRDGAALLDDWSIRDVMANTRLMLQAGTDTTAYTISNAAHLLLKHPGLIGQLAQSSEGKILSFVEEALRLHGSIHLRTRHATQDTEVAGFKFARDDVVIPLVAAANRDPARYSNPDEIDLERKTPRDHLAFHFGIRTCVGAVLARAELLETVTALVRRLPDIRLDPAAEAPALKGWLLRAYRPLHVLFTPGRKAG
jgi:cytochrome P450